MVAVSFVCLGNICRSPTAEAVFADLVDRVGLADQVTVDSAGTAGWHVGDPPDARAVAEADRRGIAMRSRGRHFGATDLATFDYVLAMDRKNFAVIDQMRGPRAAHVAMLREFARTNPGRFDVPDPYYGDDDGFVEVFDLVDDACRGFLDHLVDVGVVRVGAGVVW